MIRSMSAGADKAPEIAELKENSNIQFMCPCFSRSGHCNKCKSRPGPSAKETSHLKKRMRQKTGREPPTRTEGKGQNPTELEVKVQ